MDKKLIMLWLKLGVDCMMLLAAILIVSSHLGIDLRIAIMLFCVLLACIVGAANVTSGGDK